MNEEAAPWSHVRRMRLDDAECIVRLHKEGIPTGFLSRLSERVLTRVYRGIASSQTSDVFVIVDQRDHILGFISGTTDVKAMYRSVLLRQGWTCAALLARHLISWRMVRRIAETLLYPTKTSSGDPPAELLSLVVAPVARGRGAAEALFRALCEELQSRNCEAFRILVGANLIAANRFYEKQGCELVDHLESHGVLSNVYVKRLGPSPVPQV